ncbi:MAG TPA: autotransporter-associated beta strand repeat-containing protein, partial [Bacteroidales bacterium]|nr:autotransporter-associated beta strand repeat-containing protein [Bacteroidales bacterium]
MRNNMKNRILLFLVFLLAMHSASGQFTLATDNASNYGGTWANGNNFGSGYNAWSNSYGSNTGTFIGNPSSDGMGTSGIGTTAFGLYATGSDYVNANRLMSESMQFNDKFSFYWAMNWDANGGNKGFDIKAGGSTVFNVNNSGSATISSSNGTADDTYGTNPMFVEIVRTGDNSYSFSMTRRSSGTYTTTFTSSTAVNEIGIYLGGQNDGSGQRNIYFNHFQVTNDGNFNIGSGSTTYSKNLTGSGALNKSGSGTLVLTGANTYTGSTTISAGTLQLNHSGGSTLASSNNVTVNSGGTLRVSSNQMLNNLTVDAGGDLIVDSGVTLTINGTLTINENIELSGNLTIASGGSCEVAVNKSLTVSGTLTNSGTLTIKSNASGTGSLI